MKRKLLIGLAVIVAVVAFLWVSGLGGKAKREMLEAAVRSEQLDVKTMLMLEYPDMIRAISKGGAFGGKFSRAMAQGMFGREPEAIQDGLELTSIEELAPRTWLIRLPIVNAVLFETDEGLVLVDTGMAPGGPAILQAMRSVSDKPLHSIIYTHGHVDHAFGTWALMDAGETPEIIAQDNLVDRFERYLRLRGSLSKYMDQPLAHLPKTHEDLVWPTRTFDDRLELTIGGELFVLQHHRGETDDQLYVWVPGRKALASADYYQGFLPNAGNGKRVQRHPEDWAEAMREMAGLGAELLLPAHGEPLSNAETIRENFIVLADTLQYIVDHTIEGLNAGLRKDLIFETLELPEHLANHPSLNIQYVSPKDISKMVLKRYTGWWDDMPSSWTPAPVETRAREIVRLAGGIDALATRARELADTDIQLACYLTDMAFYANPNDAIAQELVIEIYRKRIKDPASNTMEMLTYLNQMVDARSRQMETEEWQKTQ